MIFYAYRNREHREIDFAVIIGLFVLGGWFLYVMKKTQPMTDVSVEHVALTQRLRTLVTRPVAVPVAEPTRHEGHEKHSGYKQMWVYVGNETQDQQSPYVSSKHWNSQNMQDHDVLAIFDSTFGGTFIDLAANDAHKLSNTYTLETIYDWKGVCVDANYHTWKSLAHRSCTVVAAAVGQSMNEKIPFKYRNAGDEAAYGGLIKKGMDNEKRTPNEGHVRTITLNNLFEEFNLPNVVDYLSLVSVI